jgi:hypothetical protein
MCFLLHLSVEVAHQYDFVSHCLELLVKIIFLFLFRIIGRSVAPDDVQFNVLFLGDELGRDDSGVDRFPVDESLL